MSSLPYGVYRRSDTGKLFFEVRVGRDLKLYSTLIQSIREGGLCHDIARRYSSQTAIGGKRKAPMELNYPEYSAALELDVLPVEFTKENKDRVMEVVLRQARAAALATQAMPEWDHARSRAKVQKHSGQDVGSRSVDKRSSPKKNACGPSRDAKKQLDSAGDHTTNDYLKLLDDVCEHVIQCKVEYKLKVSERKELERKVKDMTEDSGFISFQKPGPDKFHEHMACFKQLVGSDGFKFSSWLEAFEQNYVLEENECIKLREKLEGHNVKSIPESLMGDGNTMTGRRRANEEERPPLVLEIIPTPEQNSSSMPTEVDALCAPPTSILVLDRVVPENDTTMESDMSEPVASYEFALKNKYTDEEVDTFWSSLADDSTHTGCRRENEDARPAEVCADSDVQERYHDQWSPDFSDVLFPASQGWLQSCEFNPYPEVSSCIPQM